MNVFTFWRAWLHTEWEYHFVRSIVSIIDLEWRHFFPWVTDPCFPIIKGHNCVLCEIFLEHFASQFNVKVKHSDDTFWKPVCLVYISNLNICLFTIMSMVINCNDWCLYPKILVQENQKSLRKLFLSALAEKDHWVTALHSLGWWKTSRTHWSSLATLPPL